MKNLTFCLLIIVFGLLPFNMKSQSITLEKITIAMTNSEAMINFYGNVFNLEVKPFQIGEHTLYSSDFQGINILFCPNDLAGVNASQNRQQMEFRVNYLEQLAKIALENGGSFKEEIQKNGNTRHMTLLDPDGNTIVFKEVVE